MDEPGFTTQPENDEFTLAQVGRIAIWGLGLMGGSLALALKGKCAGVIGFDTNPDVLQMAQDRGIVDAAYPIDETMASVNQSLDGVGCIILAAPVQAIIQTLGELPSVFSQPMIVIDLGSTKTQILKAMRKLPENFDPVGGHPMCGKEKASLEYAEAAIYQQAPFALVPLPQTTRRAKNFAEALARVIGAQPLWMNGEDHDGYVAATSHLPFLVSSALAYATPEDSAVMLGPGFRSTARLANSSPRMMVDIMATNKENIREAIGRFKQRLDLYEKYLEQEDYEALEESFLSAGDHYRSLLEKQLVH